MAARISLVPLEFERLTPTQVLDLKKTQAGRIKYLVPMALAYISIFFSATYAHSFPLIALGYGTVLTTLILGITHHVIREKRAGEPEGNIQRVTINQSKTKSLRLALVIIMGLSIGVTLGGVKLLRLETIAPHTYIMISTFTGTALITSAVAFKTKYKIFKVHPQAIGRRPAFRTDTF